MSTTTAEDPAPAPQAAPASTSEAPAERPGRGWVARHRYALGLWIAALTTRLLWVLWIHPPGKYVFSDMMMYVRRAIDLADHGIHANRSLAWQAYGTHYVLSVPFKLFGTAPPHGEPYAAAAVLYGLFSAGAVILCYQLARRLLPERPGLAKAIGVVALLWYPNLSTSGHFLSEPPFLFFNLLATYSLVRAAQTGRGALWAGIAGALAFAVRPQSAIFWVLVAIVWLLNVRRLPKIRVLQILGIGLPLAAMLAFSLWRFHLHTGTWGGIAENANMNLTAGRCHNIVTQAFRTEAARARSERNANTRDGRRVSLPGYRILRATFPDSHPFGLRPAMGGTTIRMVGYIGDAALQRAVRRECYKRTGFWGQVQYSLVNLGLQWFVAKQWPTNERGSKVFLPITETYRHLFQIFLLAPSLVGVGLSLWRIRRDPVRAILAMQLVSIMIVAAVFFGDPRLRTPYDPYAILLGVPVLVAWWTRFRAWRRSKRSSAPSADAA